jgi:hypothetical protein
MESVGEMKKDNYIVRLFKGDVSLVTTYWVFGVLIGGLATRALFGVIEYNYSTLAVAMDGKGLVLLQAVQWLLIAYSFFILIAIWRSAGKYEGSATWSGLARGAVILNIVILAFNFWQANDIDYAMNEEMKMMNRSLPVMVDDDTRLDQVSIQEKNLFYYYTLINQSVANTDVDGLKAFMQKRLNTTVCEKAEFKPLLEQGRSINYDYNDNNDIIRITVNNSDCL